MERLQKRVANSGYTSRRQAEKLILEGRVSVNNAIITEIGYKVNDKDEIRVDDILLEKENKVYFLLNKPREVVCTTEDDKNRKIITSLIDTDLRIFPVGRLDYDTTGLIILTNDGEFANMITSPKNKIEKVYIAKIKGIIKGEEINKLKDGVEIEPGIVVKANKVKLKKTDLKSNTSMVQITITEGRNHHVKKLFAAVGFEVVKLKRERIAFFDLKGLQSGEYRKLTAKEISKVYSLNQK